MDTQQLVDWGKQMNLEGEKLCEFVRTEQAVAMDEEFVSVRKRRKFVSVRKRRNRGWLRLKRKKGLLRKQRKRG